MTASDNDIKDALAALEGAIAKRVREEQFRDQLTNLPNGNALDAALGGLVEGRQTFWLAFIEVDRFKSVNDRFGYPQANALLVKIAEQVRGAEAWFVGTTKAFRPHGDEFFLLGVSTDKHVVDVAAVQQSLDLVCQAVAALKLPTKDGRMMNCTVSIGWVVSSDVPPALTEHSVRGAVERAVAEAKLQRGCVVQYTSALLSIDVVSLRSDCPACHSKFALDVKRDRNRPDDDLTCPNCRTAVPRPAAPDAPAAERPEKI